jgi:hypothetical protein
MMPRLGFEAVHRLVAVTAADGGAQRALAGGRAGPIATALARKSS